MNSAQRIVAAFARQTSGSRTLLLQKLRRFPQRVVVQPGQSRDGVGGRGSLPQSKAQQPGAGPKPGCSIPVTSCPPTAEWRDCRDTRGGEAAGTPAGRKFCTRSPQTLRSPRPRPFVSSQRAGFQGLRPSAGWVLACLREPAPGPCAELQQRDSPAAARSRGPSPCSAAAEGRSGAAEKGNPARLATEREGPPIAGKSRTRGVLSPRRSGAAWGKGRTPSS